MDSCLRTIWSIYRACHIVHGINCLLYPRNQLWAITAMIGAALCGSVLVVIGIVAMNPVSRPHLDRVSFRILVWALLANTVFGIVNAVSGKFTGPTRACGFTIFLLQLTLEMSSFLLFSIALNLQLVVIHQLNGQKMEKFYIFGSIIISLCLTVPPYAANQYGWNLLAQDCWYSNENQKERLAWQIGTQLFWTLLTVAGEVSTALTVIIYIVRHKLTIELLMPPSTEMGLGESDASDANAAPQILFHFAHRNVIFRIIIYPVVSAVINLTSVACVIHITQNGVHNWTGYSVLSGTSLIASHSDEIGDFVYGGRAVLYALLAATDPVSSTVRAFKCCLMCLGPGSRCPCHYPIQEAGLIRPGRTLKNPSERQRCKYGPCRRYSRKAPWNFS
ncbi:hypothetical protein B0H19DRAFT_935020 [Mycena capillaripes]|nr:hypothetical protein B0H19DRAFT_935020 [Mycena capillaripes]